MAVPTLVKALAFVVFLGGIAGATYVVQRTVPSTDLEGQLIGTDILHPLLNATSGHEVTFAIEVKNRGETARVIGIELVGDGVQGASERRSVARQEVTLFFVPVRVETDKVGERLLQMRVVSKEGDLLRIRDDVATVRVLPDAPRLEPGDTATATYVGRLADTGAVFDTNDGAFQGRTFPQASIFQQRPPRPLTIATSPPNVVQGLHEGVLGMQAGESRRVVIAPEAAYGDATTTSAQPREELISREFPLPILDEQIPRASFDRYVTETRQGNASGFDVGDRFILNEAQTGNVWPYRIVQIDPTLVVYRLDPAVGEAYTLYPFWREGSVVASVNESLALFRTTPTTAQGQSFQARSYWPNMTEVSAMNETFITIRHSPPVGFRFTLPQGGQPVETTVQSVNETEIVLATPNPHPLAGQTLEFDVTILTLTKGVATG